ncbi:YceI family protein [uncultured Helicobacter sp.]|uniref:YceI family protein n=1 Tax=uncultured Helicobacter sp. TaxID=175537 RepID=UPI001C3B0529|nr:YceI family protein [Candidatus Helicobacter avicola]
MKLKLLAISILGVVGLNAASIDTNKVNVVWTAYKTPAKAAVSGTFKDINFKFGKKRDSIASTLEGASATIDPMKVNLNDDVKNANLRDFFFSKFSKKEIKVTLRDVVEGKDQGTILASVKMNGKTNKVPMEYKITNGVLKASGVLDLSEFKLNEARANLQKAVYDLHEGITWSQVGIAFEAPVTK